MGEGKPHHTNLNSTKMIRVVFRITAKARIYSDSYFYFKYGHVDKFGRQVELVDQGSRDQV